MNYVLDYLISSKTNYAYQNMNNIYNFVYEIIEMQETPEKKQRIIIMIKKEIGLTFLNNYNSYCLRKGLEINI